MQHRRTQASTHAGPQQCAATITRIFNPKTIIRKYPHWKSFFETIFTRRGDYNLVLLYDKLDIDKIPKYFNDFDSLFQKYATDDELNLQPGQSYFIAKDEDEMKKRLEYEIMPLMKEYFNEGYLLKAKDEFSNYFYNKLGVLMYE